MGLKKKEMNLGWGGNFFFELRTWLGQEFFLQKMTWFPRIWTGKQGWRTFERNETEWNGMERNETEDFAICFFKNF